MNNEFRCSLHRMLDVNHANTLIENCHRVMIIAGRLNEIFCFFLVPKQTKKKEI